jgi:hypothetical protein
LICFWLQSNIKGSCKCVVCRCMDELHSLS